MITKLPIYTLCLVFALYTNAAMAQGDEAQGGSGLSSLFKGIGNALSAAGQGLNKGNAGNTQDAVDQQSNADPSAPIIDILKIEANKIDSTPQILKSCTEDYFQKEEDRWVLGPFQRAEYSMASPGADRIAGKMAQCAMKDQANLAQWSNRVGQMLAFSVISAKRAGWGETQQVGVTAGRAIALLTYAKQKNINDASQMLDKMKENGFESAEDRTSAKQSHEKIALSTSSAEVAKKFQGNSLAFHKNYTGKILQATGTVRKVFDMRGNPPGANVILTGIVRKNPDNAQNSDDIWCEITDANAVSVAADLEPGKSITVSGLYDPNLRSYGLMESNVVLHDCQIR